MSIKSIYRFLLYTNYKVLAKFVKNIIINRTNVALNGFDTNKQIFYIDIPDNRMARYLYNLVFALTEGGYSVKIKANVQLLGNLFDYAYLILKNANTKIVFAKPSKKDLVLSTFTNKYEGSIYLNLNFYSKKINIQDELIVPLMMHPINYFNGYHNQCYTLREQKLRTKNVFFAGSIQQKNYDSRLLDLFHNTQTRHKLIMLLKKNRDDVKFPSERDELFNLLMEDKAQIIIADRACSPIYPTEWLTILSKISFFIALPGTTIPFCHNIVEAMSVGVIPILSYAHQMPKGLIDGRNCLIYDDEKSFLEKINQTSIFTDEQLKNMRREVIDYYEERLNFKNLGKLVMQHNPKQIFANAEFFSLQLLDRELNTTYTNEFPNT